MLSLLPGESNYPLFRIPRSHSLVPLTDSVSRSHLRSASQMLGLNPFLKLHDFRRAGATWAFNYGVNMKDILLHGTWKSDAVWSYIQSIPVAKSPASATFQHHINFWHRYFTTGWFRSLSPPFLTISLLLLTLFTLFT